MRLLVWGTSPQAGWLAARFHQLGYDTIWLTNEATQQDITQFGKLDLVSPNRRLNVENLKIVSTIDAAFKSPPTWIMLAMPTWALSDVAHEMSRRIQPDNCPLIVCLTHGIGGYEKLATAFGEERVIQAILTRNMTWPLLSNGHPAHEIIVSDGVGGIALTQNPHAAKLAHMLHLAGFGPVGIFEKEALLWSDVLWQIQANALATLLNIAPEQIYDSMRLFEIEYAQLREAMRVIDRLQIKLVELSGVNVPLLGWQIRVLPKSLLPNLLKPNAKSPSLYADLEQKTGRSDAAYLNGAVVRAAHALGIEAPINHILAISVTDIAEGRTGWQQIDIEYIETMSRIATRHSRR